MIFSTVMKELDLIKEAKEDSQKMVYFERLSHLSLKTRLDVVCCYLLPGTHLVSFWRTVLLHSFIHF